MSNITIASSNDLQKYFEQEPRKIIGEPRNHCVLADDILRVSNRYVNARNRIARVDAEDFPLPLHDSFAMTIEDYDLGLDGFEAESFDFDHFLNNC